MSPYKAILYQEIGPVFSERTWGPFALRDRRQYRGPFSFHGQAMARTTEHSVEFDVQPTGVAIQLNCPLWH